MGMIIVSLNNAAGATALDPDGGRLPLPQVLKIII
jgi:hypothetical protein